MIMILTDKIIKKPKKYRCRDCGEATDTVNHLCAPAITKAHFVCTYCGVSSRDPWHICMSMVKEMDKICNKFKSQNPEVEHKELMLV